MSKIPQGEWNAIAARYQGGESISKIARSYGCTPPAIHYILKRNRLRPVGILARPSTPGALPSVSAKSVRAIAQDPAITAALPRDRSEGAGPTASPVTPSTPPSTQRNAPIAALRSEAPTTNSARPVLLRARVSEPAANAEARPLMRAETAARSTAPISGLGEAAPEASGPSREAAPEASGPSATPPVALPGLDDALHLRAEAAIAMFRSSFDAARTEGSPSVRERLRQAANDLMRVAARTTIVLDRLNATKQSSPQPPNYPRSAHAGDDFGKHG